MELCKLQFLPITYRIYIQQRSKWQNFKIFSGILTKYNKLVNMIVKYQPCQRNYIGRKYSADGWSYSNGCGTISGLSTLHWNSSTTNEPREKSFARFPEASFSRPERINSVDRLQRNLSISKFEHLLRMIFMMYVLEQIIKGSTSMGLSECISTLNRTYILQNQHDLEKSIIISEWWKSERFPRFGRKQYIYIHFFEATEGR